MRTDKRPRPSDCFPNEPIPAAGQGWPVENLGCMEDPEDTGQKAINYRTEPLWKRMQHPPGKPFDEHGRLRRLVRRALEHQGRRASPQTPVFQAIPGHERPVPRAMPGGHSRNIVFALQGHEWDREPYINNSTQLGRNSFSFWEGAHMGHGPTNHFDVLLRNMAREASSTITGDYLYRDGVCTGLDDGLWGMFRVQ